jgi:hypothetical protein
MTATLHAQVPPTTPQPAIAAVALQSPQRTPPPAPVPIALTQAVPPVQTPAPAQAPPPPVRGQLPQAGQRPTTPPAPAALRRTDDENLRVPMQNIRLDLTITDSPGGGTSAKKVVTMLVADGRMGRIRSSNSVQVAEPGGFNRQILINVDATPNVRSDGRILLSLTVEYVPEVSQGASKPASINESLTVLVADGKSTLISQSADPATDRKVTVEVTATVVK